MRKKIIPMLCSKFNVVKKEVKKGIVQWVI